MGIIDGIAIVFHGRIAVVGPPVIHIRMHGNWGILTVYGMKANEYSSSAKFESLRRQTRFTKLGKESFLLLYYVWRSYSIHFYGR